VARRAGTLPPFVRPAQQSREAKERRDPPLFGLAPCGVFPATPVTRGAVRSYRTFSPLPRLFCSPVRVPHTFARFECVGIQSQMNTTGGAVYSLWHFPSTVFEDRCPDVIRHTALWSSDFPLPICAAQPKLASADRQRPSGPAANNTIIDVGNYGLLHVFSIIRGKRGLETFGRLRKLREVTTLL